MRERFLGALFAAIMATGIGAPASAQQGNGAEPPKKPPQAARADRFRNLDFLFEALKLAPDDTVAKAIEERIWAQWVVSRSDTANLLMSRVRTAIEAEETDLAIELLSNIIKIKPDYVEAWNRRATLYY